MKKCIGVVGGITVDLEGRPFNDLILRDSNPGTLEITYGGVARNIAENLQRMDDFAVCFCSAVGEDAYAKDAVLSLSSIGVDVRGIKVIPGIRTAMYLSILDKEGDMALALASMDILEHISPEIVQEAETAMSKAEAIVLDANLSPEALRYCAQRFSDKPIFVDPVSVNKAKKIREIMNRCHTIKPNKVEAEVLADMKIETEEDLTEAGRRILQSGTKRVFISLGKDGVFYMDESGSGKVRPPENFQVVSATGAGDAMSAAIVRGMVLGRDTARIARDAVLAASATLMVKAPVNPQIGTFFKERGTENEL